MKSNQSPLTFELDADLLAKLERYLKRKDVRSYSAVVRYALTDFDFSKVAPQKRPLKQISVRLSDDLRTSIQRISSARGMSLGELLRIALSALPNAPTAETISNIIQTNMAKRPTKKSVRKVAKKAAKKAVAKKATKKAAKKVIKKAPAKKVAKKAVKKVAKKAAKKAPAKKAAKKAVKKVAAKKAPAKKAARRKR